MELASDGSGAGAQYLEQSGARGAADDESRGAHRQRPGTEEQVKARLIPASQKPTQTVTDQAWAAITFGGVRSSWPGSGSVGGVAFRDLGDKGLDGGEREVRAVAEDGVTRSGKSHQAGGAVRQLAG